MCRNKSWRSTVPLLAVVREYLCDNFQSHDMTDENGVKIVIDKNIVD